MIGMFVTYRLVGPPLVLYCRGCVILVSQVPSKWAGLARLVSSISIMSVQVDVASSLLKETFGELVQKVGNYLMHHGGLALGELVKGTKLKQSQVSVCMKFDYVLLDTAE